MLVCLLLLMLIEYLRYRCAFTLCFLVGILIGWVHLQSLLQKQLPVALELATLKGQFEVISVPVVKSGSVSFKAKVMSLVCENPSKRWPAADRAYDDSCHQLNNWKKTVLLTAYKAKSSSKYSINTSPQTSDFFSLRAGDVVHAKVRLRRPRGMVNRGLFDYQAWLLSQHIYAKGYILPSTLVMTKKQRWGFESLRAYLSQRIDSVDNITFRPLFKALLLGDKSTITPEQWQVLQQTGTLHLMAISGLHIGLAAWLGFILSRILIQLNVRAVWRVTGQFYWCPFFRLLPYAVSVMTAYFYAGLAGFSVPTMRALMMVCIVNVCFMLARRVSLYRIFILAALIIVLLDPFVFLATGFWLSFGAVFVLMLVYKPDASYVHYEGMLGRLYVFKRYFMLLNRMQWVLFLGLLFPVFFLTGTVSWVAPLANIFMVPLVSFVIVPLLFLISVLFFIASKMASLLLNFADTLMQYSWCMLSYLTSLQDTFRSFIPFSVLSLWAVILGCMAVICFFIFKPICMRLASLSLVLILILYRSDFSPHFRLSVLDVGQGLSVVITHKNETMVYDTGVYLSPTFDMGKNIIAPSLKYHHIHTIDTLVISHSDNDHIGGAASLMSMLPVDRLLVSSADAELTLKTLFSNKTANQPLNLSRQPSSRQPPIVETCMRENPLSDSRNSVSADSHRASTFHVTPLWPIHDKKYADLLASTNNRSCVLLVEVDGLRILLTGDIDRKVERVLIDLGIPKVDILIAPHHGSKTSSSSAFIDALSPSAVIFSSGYKNKYGHPHPLVVDNYTQRNIKTFNTALDGEVYLLYDINKPYHVDHIKTARDQFNAWR